MHQKWLKRQLKDANTSCTTAYRPQVQKSVNTFMKKHFGRLFTRMAVPSEFETLRDDIFNPQGWAIAENHAHMSPPPFGVGEARLLLEGSYVVAGIRKEAFPLAGATAPTYKSVIEMLQKPGGIESFMQKATNKYTHQSFS